MGDRFDYWISGVSVQVQTPSAVRQMVRYTWGTDISQDYNKKENKRSENWFHFAIPTPTMLDGDKVDYKHAYIQGFINDHAYIKRVVISHGGANKYKRIFEGNYSSLMINPQGIAASIPKETFSTSTARSILSAVLYD